MKMVSWMNFKEELKDRVDHIEAILKEYLPKEEGWQKTVIAAIKRKNEKNFGGCRCGNLSLVWFYPFLKPRLSSGR